MIKQYLYPSYLRELYVRAVAACHLCKGGLTAGWLATGRAEETSGRQYAMKRMRKSAVVQCPEHVFCEQAITRNTAHPFCLRQYASFQDKLHLYFLFDLMPGGDLMDVLVAEARVIKRRIAQGAWKRACLAPKARAPPARPSGPPCVLACMAGNSVRWREHTGTHPHGLLQGAKRTAGTTSMKGRWPRLGSSLLRQGGG